jgi:hypothetical protein
VNLLSLSLCNLRRLILAWLRCMGASARESRVSVAIYSFTVVGRPGLHPSGLTSSLLCWLPFSRPTKNDLTNYWAFGPFVKPFTSLVDPGDIHPPQSWASKKQNSVALSTAEAEYIAAGHCCAQLLWMRQTLRDYGYKLTKVPLLCDNESAIKMPTILSSIAALNT